jgi:membrane protease YdiL (CAAX protease family)
MVLGCCATSHALELPPREELTTPSPAVTREKEILNETARLREAADFSGLDALATELRQSRESFLNGTWLLTSFYGEAVKVPRKDPAGANRAIAFYERWATEKPESITAQLCLADAYVDYAWAARGSGWGNTVTDEGWRLMAERLEKAWDVLQKASRLEEKCPHWFAVAQTVALGEAWERERYMKMVNEAIQREPSFGDYYNNACYWLLPRWHGEEGDFEKWIAEQADAHPDKDKHYARLVWQADSLGMPDELVFADDRLDWERAKRGFIVWLEEAPDSIALRFELTRLAVLADDPATAREQFEITGGKYWPGYWQGKAAVFEQARRFAFESGPNPLRQVAETRSKSLDPRFVQGIGILGHALGGCIAGTLCLILGLRRKQAAAAVLMFVICIVLAILYGTLAAALPAFVFAAYIWSKEPEDFTERPPHLWGITLLWVILVMGLNLGMQIVATMLALFPALAGGGASAVLAATKDLMASGEGFAMVANSQWISLLLLLVLSAGQTVPGLRARFGFHATPWGRAAIYIVVGALVICASGYLSSEFQDERTKEALELIAQGVHSPALFLLAVVILAPLFEELLMRGYAFQGLMPKFGFYGTAIATSIIFALCHIQYGWAGLLHVFILGFVLSWIRSKTGSIYPCIALHTLNNLAYTVSIWSTKGSGL